MENLIQLQRGSKAYASKALFEEASFAVNAGEHVGVIGPNGAGKTTLFRILVGDEPLDDGQVIRSRGLSLGYLSQHDAWEPDETIESVVSRGARLPIWELKALGRGLGLDEEHFARPILSFSGGYRMRAKLLGLLGQEPNLMLLDEPTNYLDLETLLVLEKFLQGFRGAFLLISHDREFLRRVTDHTMEIEDRAITKYNGNIDDYFEQKELLRAQLEARAMSLEDKRREILAFVARFGAKATKASQAQSRLKTLDKMESIEVRPLSVGARIRIPPPARAAKLALRARGVDLGYGERVVLRSVDVQWKGDEHVAVVGLNGAGKSTLLKALAGRLPPLRGRIESGYEVSVAYFAQHVAEELSPDDTVLRALERKAHPSVIRQDILDLAGSLLFSGDAVRKPVRVLSGGERSRVALGQVLLQKASCLILDEPTNHLDFQTVEALTQALHDFQGALVIVSHDRGFIRRVGTSLLEIHGGRASPYPGTYEEYVWSIEKGAYATLVASGPAPAAVRRAGAVEAGAPKQNYKDRKKTLDRRLKQLETALDDAERGIAAQQARLQLLNERLVEGAPDSPERLVAEMADAQEEIERCEARWLQAEEEKAAVLRELGELTGAAQALTPRE